MYLRDFEKLSEALLCACADESVNQSTINSPSLERCSQ